MVVAKNLFSKKKKQMEGIKAEPQQEGTISGSPVRATVPGPQPQAIGGAINLKHCVAGVVLRGGACPQ